MERKTKIHAEDGKQTITITREFELPVELLFTAHTETEIFEQWMSDEYGTTKVLKLEVQKHGAWEFQRSDPAGNVVFRANGVIHDQIPNQKIVRTFEMVGSPFEVQLDFLEFESLGEDRSKLTMHSVYRSVELRDQLLKLPFAHGLNMAHDRLEKIVSKLK
jgi:uncharacterized protein YndB with AHSA1/START domain